MELWTLKQLNDRLNELTGEKRNRRERKSELIYQICLLEGRDPPKPARDRLADLLIQHVGITLTAIDQDIEAAEDSRAKQARNRINELTELRKRITVLLRESERDALDLHCLMNG